MNEQLKIHHVQAGEHKSQIETPNSEILSIVESFVQGVNEPRHLRRLVGHFVDESFLQSRLW